MKVYLVFLIQMLIWSAFSIIEWLSGRDRPFFKGLLLFVFLYIAFLIAQKIGLRSGKAFVTTVMTLIIYFGCQQLFWGIVH